MAENKATTLEQLRALAERGKLDTLNRVDQLLESIIPLLEGAQHSGTTVTLPAENWSGRAQTVKDNILALRQSIKDGRIALQRHPLI